MRARSLNSLLLLAALMGSGCGNVVEIEDVESEDLGLQDLGDAPDASPAQDQGGERDMMVIAPDMRDTSPDTPDMQAPQDMGSPDMTPPAQELPAFYPDGQTLWPLTPYGVAQLEKIAAKNATRAEDVFIKVGDSNTVNTNFLHCFAGQSVNLADHSGLSPAWRYFQAGAAQGKTPFDRVSLSATVGWSAGGALSGAPSPLQQEIDALNPRFAFVQFGTNDIQSRNIFRYADQMTEIVELLMQQGVIPLLTSIAPRADDAAADAWVPRYNAVMRGLAQAHQLPFIDLHRELVQLPQQGLGGDRLHLNAYTQGARACELTTTGLGYGQNMRNLLSLQGLSRLHDTLHQGQPAPQASPAQVIDGLGTHEQPYLIPSLPFTDRRDTSAQGDSLLDRYTGCSATQDESGQEIVYELSLTQRTTVRAMVFDQGTTDIDLHILDDTLSPQGCLARDHQDLSLTLDPGVYYIVLDTFVGSDQRPRSGPYLFTLLAE